MFADQHDFKHFYDAVKELYGPSTRGGAPLLSNDSSTLLTNQMDILNHWEEHSNDLLNWPSQVEQSSIDIIPQKPIVDELANQPSVDEIRKAIKLLSNGKSPGDDGIPAEIFKHGGYICSLLVCIVYMAIFGERRRSCSN